METFSQTSHEPYNRHNYRLYLKSGKVLNFEDYDEAQAYWFNYSQVPDYLDLIEVIDKPKSKEKIKSRGFGS